MASDAVVVRNLSFCWPGKEPLLQDISFCVKQGEILVIAGHSGCGKSTLCSILCGIIPNSVKGEMRGTVELMGQDLREMSLPRIAQQAGMVFQNVDMQFVCTTVEDELAFGLENLCVDPEEIRRRVEEALREWNLQPLRLRDPGSLSGGQKRIVAMASILILNPPVIILDEPVSHLDEPGRELVRSAAEKLRRQGRTVVMVEHDLSLVTYADHWLLIDGGTAAAENTPEYFRANPEILRRLELI